MPKDWPHFLGSAPNRMTHNAPTTQQKGTENMENYRYERVLKICEDLQSLMTVRTVPITGWKIKRGFYLTPEEVDHSPVAWEDFNPQTDTWPGPDAHYWFRTSLDIPRSFVKKPLWLNFATQAQFWDAVNPQFLLFLNGQILQGLDVNHQEVFMTSRAKAGERLVLDMQAYTGRDNDHNQGSTDQLRLFASIVERDAAVSECYYNLMVPNKIAGYLPKENKDRIQLQLALEKAVNLLDLREPYSREFYSSVKEANRFLKNEVYKKLAGHDDVIATCVGHTHIDIAWWWTVEQTREKAARSFATVLKLMEEFPDYKFMSSQPQLYRFVKDRYPELYERIKKRIKEGRWEPEGGMWVEADCNVTSGESLVRQFLHGKRYFREEFGKDNRVLWLPDVFGYSAALPQIMKKSGIDYFMTTKIAWSQFNKLPCDTFWWKGIDGTEVFTHLITTQDEGQAKDSFYTTYNGNLNPVSVMRAWDRYQQKDLNNDVMISYGFGDGGGGPTRAMLEVGNRMKAGITGAPKVRMETSRKYFDQLYSRAAQNPDLPRWVGELYLEYHRGTYTSMARNKRSNRRCELMWQDVEFFSVYASMLGIPYKAAEIYAAWETILLNQFHDILPGSSIKEVYETTKTEYAELERKAKALIVEKLTELSSAVPVRTNDLVLFNSMSFDRDDYVELEADGFSNVSAFVDAEGTRLPVQRTSYDKLIFKPTNVPAKGWSAFTPYLETHAGEPRISVKGSQIETPFYRIQLDRAGQFSSLFDKQAGRELLKPGEKGNVLRAYEDKPIYYDNWDIDIYYAQKSWAVENVQKIEWAENGPVRAVLKITRKFLESTIVQRVNFYADSRRIDFDTYVDWKQHQVLLKAEFPVDINAYEATYDIQFGNIKRPAHKNTSWDAAKFEVCGHKWADLSEGGYGVALLNDCKYGYGICEGKMTLSLIKSGVVPNPTTDQEEHWFTYSLYPHMGDCYQANVAREAYCLNVPLYGIRRSSSMAQLEKKIPASFLTINADNVIVETVKQAESGIGTILRLYENQNRRTNVTVTWHGEFLSVVECDLMENELAKPTLAGHEISFTIKPFEIKTFKVIE